MRTALAIAGLLVACLAASGCGPRQPARHVEARPRYTLGPPWQSDGYWFYPSEETSYRATGLAVVDAPEAAPRRITADGERYDPDRLAASHQTLQLPVMLHVRNLENGRGITLRVDDRGPASPGRLLSVTPRAARLLGMVPGQATRISVEQDPALSQDLLDQVDDAPRSDTVGAPVGVVREQSLMDRPQSPAVDTTIRERAVPAARPGDSITMEPVQPGQLWIDAGRFMQSGYARRLAADLSGTVRQEGHGRSAIFLVRLGPFNLPDEADAALDHARSAGVTGARIIVE